MTTMTAERGSQASVQERPARVLGESPSHRVAEAIASLRDKDVRSTTFERLCLTEEADRRVQGLGQPLQLGEGLTYLLDRISLPVAAHDLLLGRITERVPDESEEAFFQATIRAWDDKGVPPWIMDLGHECFAWGRLLSLGLPGLEAFARQQLTKSQDTDCDTETLAFLTGAIRIYEALREYSRRYARAALQTGLEQAGARCAALAERPPESFAEALQLIWLVGHVYCTMVARNPTLTFGRLDELLLPYYRRDLARELLTREGAAALIEDFYCKNNLILGRGEHQMGLGGTGELSTAKDTGWVRNLTYDAPQYVVLGGTRADGSASSNELTELFLEGIVPRFENPVIVLRYTSDLPGPVWELACEKMRANASMLVYNDHDIVPAMVSAGIDPDDALTYTMHGCNWPDIPGIQFAARTYGIDLPNLLRHLLLTQGEQMQSMDDVHAGLSALIRREAETLCREGRAVIAARRGDARGELRVDDCFLDGPIAAARSKRAGGVKYGSNLIMAIRGIASVADGMAALEELVFGAGRVSLETLQAALRADYVGFEALRQRCLRAPKYGQDDDRADGHAVRALEATLDAIEQASGDDLVVFPCLETDMRHIPIGRELGATPDGRRAGQPISENTSATPGSAQRGLTAMLRAVAKLPFQRICSGALNIRLRPQEFDGQAGLSRLAQVLRSYLDMGGLQVQLSFADLETLRDAQAHPEQHRDLMVRITGYSACFVDMTRSAQDEIIRREEMGG